MELHYHSPRPGYGAWVVGICEAVARDVFQTWVHFKLVEGRHDGSADHEVGGGLGIAPESWIEQLGGIG